MWHALVAGSGTYQVRELGASQFANTNLYHEDVRLPDQSVQAYLDEGYLLLRHLVPPQTVEALRQEILRTCGPFESNAWLENDALQDFVIFGPLAAVAAQLHGREDVHLLRTVHHFHFGIHVPVRIPYWHYDHGECQMGYTPAKDTPNSLVKFYVPLYDNMPSMWFMNQSMFEEGLRRMSGARAEQTVASFRNGTMGTPPGDICAGPPEACPPWLPRMTSEYIDRVSLKPMLRLGDVLVHASTLVHRSAPSNGGGVTGWLAAAYAVPETRFRGSISPDERECHSGVDPKDFQSLQRLAYTPRIADHPRTEECFPRVYPRDTAQSRIGTVRYPIRADYWDSARNVRDPLRRYVGWKLWQFSWVSSGRHFYGMFSTDLPDSNIVMLRANASRESNTDSTSGSTATSEL
eukprot:gnl/TRDRNA2_/TRDRNA2_93871_c1_seq1.p1 gnl/TRDRNA2_/TRDRNA2_93871_c1~~gnl/TRDRNA2_/TRDRNA2_93871_c1_seq1.p1  ORF type:complete len:406 (-),score=42.57 gnl/TRDRNA2_/TRDRNA2_93871_c1_seq1:43-1260(-)